MPAASRNRANSSTASARQPCQLFDCVSPRGKARPRRNSRTNEQNRVAPFKNLMQFFHISKPYSCSPVESRRACGRGDRSVAPGPGCVSRRRSPSRPSASGAPPRRSSPGAPPLPGASHASSAWPWSMFSGFISSRLLTRRASTARAGGYCGRALSRAPYGRQPPAGRSVHRRRQSGVVRTGRRALRCSPENPASAVPFVILQILFRPHYHDVQFALQFVGAIQDSRVPRKEDVPSSQIVDMKVAQSRQSGALPGPPGVAPARPAMDSRTCSNRVLPSVSASASHWP